MVVRTVDSKNSWRVSVVLVWAATDGWADVVCWVCEDEPDPLYPSVPFRVKWVSVALEDELQKVVEPVAAWLV